MNIEPSRSDLRAVRDMAARCELASKCARDSVRGGLHQTAAAFRRDAIYHAERAEVIARQAYGRKVRGIAA